MEDPKRAPPPDRRVRSDLDPALIIAIMVCDITVLQYSLYVQRITYNIKKNIANKLRNTSARITERIKKCKYFYSVVVVKKRQTFL